MTAARKIVICYIWFSGCGPSILDKDEERLPNLYP